MPKINQLTRASRIADTDLIPKENSAGTSTESATAAQLAEYFRGKGIQVDNTLSTPGAAADAAKTGAEVADLKNAIIDYNAYDVLKLFGTYQNRETNGITYTWNADKTVCTVNGTASGYANDAFYSNTGTVPSQIVPGKRYTVHFTSAVSSVGFSILSYHGGSSSTYDTVLRATTTGVYTIQIPNNITGLVVRFDMRPGDSASYAQVSVALLGALSNADLDNYIQSKAYLERGSLSGSADLDDVKEDGVFFISYPNSNAHYPLNFASWMLVSCSPLANGGKLVQQVLIPYFASSSASSLQQANLRRNFNGTAWSTWEPFAGNGASYTNNYEYTTNQNTYNVTATPSITTDTNNYLATTGTSADRTTDIVTMLTSSGICNLGPGVFYVNNLVMPDRSVIRGSGSATRVIMSGTSDGCAIQMGKKCAVQDMQIMGATAEPTLTTVGGRHGILWSGTFAQDQSSANQPQRGIVSNVWISWFTGGAITCYNTGTPTYCALEVTNAFIDVCGVGLNISYYSEYHKFTNIRTSSCIYGCINNGGNNMFVNCDFSTCKNGLLMDNSTGQSPNNSHGSMVGCVFNHINSNTGVAITILNCDNGFTFDGCQIFYGQIQINDSDGVTIANSVFGTTNTDITISGGGVVLFANNTHGSAPTITVTNNANVHFVNCYVRSTGAVVSN